MMALGPIQKEGMGTNPPISIGPALVFIAAIGPL